jgi:hypothetical protein
MSDDDLSGLPPEQPAESGSLEDHEAAFGPNGTGEAPRSDTETTSASSAEAVDSTGAAAETPAQRDEQGRFQKPRHKAQSQRANPEDVPRIRELTARLKAAEAERDALKAPKAAEPRYLPPPQPQQAAPPGTIAPTQPFTPPPTRTKPSEDEIGDKYKTYADFVEDLADWQGEQREAKRDARQQAERREQTQREWATSYTTQLAEAKTRYPDFDTQVQATDETMQRFGIVLPQVLQDAILSSSRGADISYYLATHHDAYRDLIRDAWAVNHPNSIAMVRKVLESSLPPVATAQRTNGSDAAADTGSARRSPHIAPAPRPPNPVRTGPQKIDDVPDDDSSLEAHESHYYKRR